MDLFLIHLLVKIQPFEIAKKKTDVIPGCNSLKILILIGEPILTIVGLSDLGVTCSPRDPRIACSNPAEVDGLFQDVKILSTSPPGGTLSWGSRV